jgi:hypothetical protein
MMLKKSITLSDMESVVSAFLQAFLVLCDKEEVYSKGENVLNSSSTCFINMIKIKSMA